MHVGPLPVAGGEADGAGARTGRRPRDAVQPNLGPPTPRPDWRGAVGATPADRVNLPVTGDDSRSEPGRAANG